jgi:hypothetical protein
LLRKSVIGRFGKVNLQSSPHGCTIKSSESHTPSTHLMSPLLLGKNLSYKKRQIMIKYDPRDGGIGARANAINPQGGKRQPMTPC